MGLELHTLRKFKLHNHISDHPVSQSFKMVAKLSDENTRQRSLERNELINDSVQPHILSPFPRKHIIINIDNIENSPC